jgi:hypothetical protein
MLKNRVGLREHVAVCVGNGSVKIPSPLLGNGSVKNKYTMIEEVLDALFLM